MVVVDMFIQRKRTLRTYKNPRLVQGHGINDADYHVQYFENGRKVTCPFYNHWQHMLQRAYSKVVHKKQPTYLGTTVCKDWLLFSNFKSWMETQDWEGNHLDKDIVSPGNKHYSPATCVFVSLELNNLLCKNRAKRGAYLQGANKHKATGLIISQISLRGVNNYLGVFETELEASQAYNKAKSDHILVIAAEQTDERITNGLRLHAQLYLEGKVE